MYPKVDICSLLYHCMLLPHMIIQLILPRKGSTSRDATPLASFNAAPEFWPPTCMCTVVMTAEIVLSAEAFLLASLV